MDRLTTIRLLHSPDVVIDDSREGVSLAIRHVGHGDRDTYTMAYEHASQPHVHVNTTFYPYSEIVSIEEEYSEEEGK